MYKVYVIIIWFLFFFHEAINGQQLPLFSQYRTHQGLINPASISNDYWIHNVRFLYSGSYRRQWTGFDASPRTMNIQGVFIKKLNKINLIGGGAFLSDKIGREHTNGFYGRIGGIVTLTNDFFISVGLQGGLVNYRVELDNVSVFSSAELLATTTQSQLYPDVGMGINFLKKINKSENIYLGISVPQLLGLDLNFNRHTLSAFQVERIRHYYGLAGFTKQFTGFKLESSAWIKYVKNAPVHLDVNVRLHLDKFGWIGAGYAKQGVFFDIGININRHLRIGYGVSSPLGSVVSGLGTSHEFNIGNGIPTKVTPDNINHQSTSTNKKSYSSSKDDG